MALRLRYFSDLHLEFIKPHKIEKFIKQIPSGIDEICILAGDIGNPHQPNYDTFMKYISQNFKKTFVIPGNHEYYNKLKTIQETNNYMKDYFQRFKNISYLNNSYEHYEGSCFIGTTLWSKITNPEYKINDVYNIPNFDYNQYNQLHITSVDFLERAIDDSQNCVVITHHVPSSSLIDVKYKTERMLPYNQWFYADMDELIRAKGDKIKCWFYGHTHTPSNVVINGIPFLCNPIGYPGENNKIYFQSIIEI
jgi:predicted MPP superfamily phosphohydrolase